MHVRRSWARDQSVRAGSSNRWHRADGDAVSNKGARLTHGIERGGPGVCRMGLQGAIGRGDEMAARNHVLGSGGSQCTDARRQIFLMASAVWRSDFRLYTPAGLRW
jgi:hypothetical protein